VRAICPKTIARIIARIARKPLHFLGLFKKL
jgi:hypothetical protein